MHSGHQPSPLDSRPIAIGSPVLIHQESSYPAPPRRGRLSTFPSGVQWNLEAPSDADLDDEQHLSASLSRSGAPSSTSTGSPAQDSPSISASPAAMFLAAFGPSMKAVPLPDDEGQAVAGYTLGGIIGYGGSSIIRRAFSSMGGIVAVKIVKHSELQKQPNFPHTLKKLQHEAEIWSSLSHEHILPLFAAVHSSYADFFVTPFCPAGSLYDILQRDGTPALPHDDAGMMFRQVVRGLRYLHEVAMYVHRDIKLENVLVDEMGVCRIADFGMSKKIGEIDEDDLESDVEEQNEHEPFSFPGNNAFPHRAATFSGPPLHRQSSLQSSHVAARHNGPRHRNSTSTTHLASPAHQPGSLPYASPEILLPQTHGPIRSHPSQDIWALGVLLYTLLTGQFPFCDSFEPRLQMKILQGTFDIPPGIGKGAERVLRGCLEKSTQLRWSISMVDEVAWGVGWGCEGDDVTPSESDAEFEPHCPPSRSRSRPPAVVLSSSTADALHDSGQSRHVREAASRRSASRAKRSEYRAPVPTRSRSRGVISRHNSRAPSPSPTSIISESPFLSSPTFSIDRGRRLIRNFPSRSPSPSIIPGTPIDVSGILRSSFSSSLPVVDHQVDELTLDSLQKEGERRGRSKSTREIRASPLSNSASFSSLDNDNVDVLYRVGTSGNGFWGGEEITESELVGQTDRPDYHHQSVATSEKERSRSCGYSLKASSTKESLINRTMQESRRLSHYFEPYEYDHEFWTRRRNMRTGSTPQTPTSPWSARVPAANSQVGKPPLFAAAINELLKKKNGSNFQPPPVSHPEMPAMMKRERSLDCATGWS